MHLIRFILPAVLLVCSALPHSAAAANPTTVLAILINASNEKGPADPRLAPYEGPLQRNLPESSFRYVGEGSASLAGADSRATIALGGGHRVEIDGEPGAGNGIRLKLQWMNERNVVMRGTFTLQPGVPIVLGRRPSGNGQVPIVLVIAR